MKRDSRGERKRLAWNSSHCTDCLARMWESFRSGEKSHIQVIVLAHYQGGDPPARRPRNQLPTCMTQSWSGRAEVKPRAWELACAHTSYTEGINTQGDLARLTVLRQKELPQKCLKWRLILLRPLLMCPGGARAWGDVKRLCSRSKCCPWCQFHSRKPCISHSDVQ